MRVEMRPLSAVRPYERNPRRNEGAVEKVAESIRAFGFRQPIVVDGDGVVIVGHTRLLAAHVLKLAQVPVHVAEGLTPEQVRAYRLMDNRSHEEAGWDPDLLGLELVDLKAAGFNLGLTGFDAGELADLLAGVGRPGAPDPDEVPAVPALVRSSTGDVWLCGPHRITCGDATIMADVERACGSREADVVWTDPPYNVAYEGAAGSITNDDLSDSKFAEFLGAALRNTCQALKRGAAIYVAHADTEGLAFRRAFAGAGLKLSGCVIWRKDALVLGRSDYQWQHEPILYGWRPGARHRWFGGRKQTTVADFALDPFIPLEDGRWQVRVGDRVLIIDGDAEVQEVEPTVITEERPRRSVLHPTMKPVALVERMLKNSARPGDLVLDPFGGSGSTLIAAERLGMRACLLELEPGLCDVMVMRWQEYAGDVARREADGCTFESLEPRRLAA